MTEALTLVHDLLILSTNCRKHQLLEVGKDDNESELPWISNFTWDTFAATPMQDATILDS